MIYGSMGLYASASVTYKLADKSVKQRSDLWGRLREITQQIERRHWQLIGQLRMNANDYPKVALSWSMEGRSPRGRLKEIWRRTVEKKGAELSFKGCVMLGFV